jgi:N utilization substance protein A
VFVTRALAPAKVIHLDAFEIEKKMTVVVENEKLSLAIGRNGQNARLASKLTGWKINILSESQFNEQKRREAEMLMPVSQVEGIGAKIRDKLIEADISSVQRLAQASVESLTKIEGIGEKTAEKLIERAQQLVAQLEEEYNKRHTAEKVAAEAEVAQSKLKEADVFEDSPDYVSEIDDIRQAKAPDLDEDIEDDDATPSASADDEEIDE